MGKMASKALQAILVIFLFVCAVKGVWSFGADDDKKVVQAQFAGLFKYDDQLGTITINLPHQASPDYTRLAEIKVQALFDCGCPLDERDDVRAASWRIAFNAFRGVYEITDETDSIIFSK